MRITIHERSVWGTVCNFSAKSESTLDKKNSEDSESTESLIPIEHKSCAYIDDGGFAFAPAPFLDGFLIKKIFINESDIKIGENAVSESKILLYENMIRSFKATDTSVMAMLFEMDIPRDARVYAGKWHALIARDADPEKIAEVLKLIMATELKGKLDELQYIDLRFGNKVFYKLRRK